MKRQKRDKSSKDLDTILINVQQILKYRSLANCLRVPTVGCSTNLFASVLHMRDSVVKRGTRTTCNVKLDFQS